MSRIHEALKRAEQERAAQTNASVADSLFVPAPAISEPTKPAGAETLDDIAEKVLLPDLGNSSYVRFADLLARCVKAKWNPDPTRNVFFHPDQAAHGAEQFRTLRSRLYQLRASQTLRNILVTSSIPGEGKTFVTNNLAQAIVRQPEQRVLIIDADIRRPRLHLPLGASLAPGLTDYLRGELSEFEVIQMGQGNLCLVPGGNEVTNPAELLSNGRLKKLLERLTPVFDWIILDSPPCLPVADASVLADMCDGVLLIVRVGSTPAEVAQRACQNLQGKNVLGVVLNAVEKGHIYDQYSYGYTEDSETRQSSPRNQASV